MKKLLCSLLASSLLLVACMREPDLHLYEAADADIVLPMVDLTLDYYWELAYGIDYDWQAEWWYGWDERDKELFGDLEPAPPTEYNLRRYYTGSIPLGPHLYVLSDMVYGDTFHGRYEWGFWDALVWNNIKTVDGVQSLNFDESSLERVIAYTNPSMMRSRYQAPKYTRSFYAPELLFAAYEQQIEINENLTGFEFDAERNVYVKKLSMKLLPITYVYLTQVILHNNRGRIAAVDGSANLSGMARSVEVNSGVSGSDAITVYYNVRMKKDSLRMGERVDMVGGRLLTFGICNQEAQRIARRAEDLGDTYHHYMDVTMQFNNGLDSTFVFDVTDQVRQRNKGGVITVELDMDTVPIPHRSGGSAFNAVVEDFEEETHEFEM